MLAMNAVGQVGSGKDQNSLIFENLSTGDGLSDASVLSVYQDRFGMIWIGTRNGLNLYDGENMTIFGTNQGLSNPYIYDVQGSHQDSLIWMGTRSGVWILDRHNGSVKPFSIGDGTQPVVTQILNEGDSVFWFTTFSGLAHWEGTQLSIYQADSLDPYSILDDRVINLARVNDSLLYVGSENGLNIFNTLTRRFRNIRNDSSALFSRVRSALQTVYQRPNGEIWLGSYGAEEGAIATQVMPDGSFRQYMHDPVNPRSLAHNFSILSFVEDTDGRLWLGMNGGGVAVFDDQTKDFTNIGQDDRSIFGLNDIDVWELFLDNQGVMWVGTDGGGINFYHPAYNRFQYQRKNPFNPESINSNQILTMEDSDTALWLGTNSGTGLARYSKRSGAYHNYPFDEDLRYSLSDNTVYDLELTGHFLWIVSYAGGLSQLDITNDTFEHFYSKEGSMDGFRSNFMTTIVPDGDMLWLAGGAGLAAFDRSTYEQMYFDNPRLNTDHSINHMARRGNRLWIGTEFGIQWFDLEAQSFEPIPDYLEELPNVNHIYHGRHHTWVGTIDGLRVVKGGSSKIVSLPGQLSDEYIQSITGDNQGRIWVSTKKGLNLLCLEQDYLIRFYEKDGLHGDYFNQRAVAQGVDGRIYFGGNQGYTIVDPNGVAPLSEVVHPQFREAVVMEQDTTRRIDLLGVNALDLAYDQATFTLDFYVPDYIRPEKLSFKYKIRGLNDQYFPLSQSAISITDLSPGNYEIAVYTTNADGIWSETPATIAVSISPPFWQTWYAYLFYLLLIAGVFLVRDRYIKAEKQRLEGIVASRTEELRKQKETAEQDRETIARQSEKLKELDEVKTRFFSNISHEFRTPLTLIQGPLEALLSGKVKDTDMYKNNLQVARRNVATLRNLIDELLEFNKMEMGELNVQYVPVQVRDFFRELARGYALMAREQGLEWEAHIEPDESLRLELPADHLQRIVHNLVSNAMKNSGPGQQVIMTAAYRSAELRVSIQDFGPGIAKNEQERIFEHFYQSAHGKLHPHSSGIGLAYVKEITDVLGGRIDLESTMGAGSIFTLSIPAQITTGIMNTSHLSTEDELPVLEAYPYPNNKILIVEDNEEMSDYIRQVLGEQFDMEVTGDGLSAIEAIGSFDPDLIISDIMMPVMDGMELLDHIKSHDKWKYKSVVMLTAKSSHEVRLEALALGIDDYLTKPFSPLELEIRVKNILRNQFERAHSQDGGPLIHAGDPLMKELVEEIEHNLANRNFGVSELSSQAALSDRQLTRITKKALGLTPALLIREVKLQKARTYLERQAYRSVNEVAYAVGFEKPSYFARIYFGRFGKKPSAYFR